MTSFGKDRQQMGRITQLEDELDYWKGVAREGHGSLVRRDQLIRDLWAGTVNGAGKNAVGEMHRTALREAGVDV